MIDTNFVTRCVLSVGFPIFSRNVNPICLSKQMSISYKVDEFFTKDPQKRIPYSLLYGLFLNNTNITAGDTFKNYFVVIYVPHL